MTTANIREQLHHFIDNTEDKRVKIIYALFENEIKNEDWDYTDEFKKELDRRYEAYKKDGKVITRDAMNKRIKKLLKAKA